MADHLCSPPIAECNATGDVWTCHECGSVYEFYDDPLGRYWERIVDWEDEDDGIAE